MGDLQTKLDMMEVYFELIILGIYRQNLNSGYNDLNLIGEPRRADAESDLLLMD